MASERADTLGKEACQECGLLVPRGYIKCPKCKAPMASQKLSGRELKQGGTTVTQGRKISYGLVLVLGVLTLIVVQLAKIQGNDSILPHEETRAPAAVAAPTPTAPMATANPLDASLDRLGQRLAQAGLHAWVDMTEDEPPVLVVRSQLCGSGRVAAVVQKNRALLESRFAGYLCIRRRDDVVTDVGFAAAGDGPAPGAAAMGDENDEEDAPEEGELYDAFGTHNRE